ncbi:MAG: hypothetical protein RML72_07520 [Bacteroidia bacterium]|nr:hypothetical protein [Bacteroidia bacterium]MDW8158708.1 hypothetical protein [Bacteroidia bacterium]
MPRRIRVAIIIIKITLAILFFLCLLEMPYGFYQLVRFLAFVGFGFIALKIFEQEENRESFIYAVLALLFQPFFKLSLGRTLWNIVDVLVGIGLIFSLFSDFNNKK